MKRFLKYIVVALCVWFMIPVYGNDELLQWGPFSVDTNHVYGEMQMPIQKQDFLMIVPNEKTIFLPIMNTDSTLELAEEPITVTLTFQSDVEKYLETLHYEHSAQLVYSKEDPSVKAWLVQWEPNWKELDASLEINENCIAKIQITAEKIDETPIAVEGELAIRIIQRAEDTEPPVESEVPPIESEVPPIESEEPLEESETPPAESETPVEDVPTVDIGGSGGYYGSGSVVSEPEPSAKIQLIRCETDKMEIHAGDRVVITAVLRNNSSVSAVEDIRIVYECPSGELTPSNATNSIYVDYIGKGDTYAVSFPIEVAYTLTSFQQRVSLVIEYTDKSAAPLSVNENIFLNILPSFDVRLNQPTIAGQAEEESLQDISIMIYNTGQSKVKNIMGSVEIPGFESAGTAFGGDLNVGENKELILKTLVEPVLDANQEKVYGKTTGVIHVQYEDESGRAYMQDVPVSAEIIPKGGEIEEEKPERTSQWWISIIGGLVGIEILTLILVWVNRKRSV